MFGRREERLDINLLPPCDAVRKQKKKNILEDLIRSVLSQFKNVTPLET